MSIVLQGSTSGSVTLQEPAVAGTTVLDLPAVSGTILTTGSSGQSIPKAALPTGSVLQVVQGTTSTANSNSTNTYADTGLTATITPTSATSKILIIYNHGQTSKEGGTQLATRLLRGSTTVYQNQFFDLDTNTAARNKVSTGGLYLDSPATTSSTTYKTQFMSAQNIASVGVMNDNSTAVMILMEIAA
jgi:hypothetical protein